MSNPFITTSEAAPSGRNGMATAPMGTRTDGGRYKVPATLPGDKTPQMALRLPPHERWVSGGLQSMTNLAASISDTQALGKWITQQTMIGLGMHHELRDQLTRLVYQAKAADVDFQSLRAHPEFRDELDALTERAKDIGGGNSARDAGIYRHDLWEARASAQETDLHEEFAALEALLDAADFERVPGLSERTVRNVSLIAAGRFDDILLHRRTGKLHIADLKTKRKPFWTFLEIDAQLAGYAFSEHMLTLDGQEMLYVPGPVHHVDLTEGVVLHMPSDGGEQRLRRADLQDGIQTMRLARQVCERRSRGRSAARLAESWWPTS